MDTDSRIRANQERKGSQVEFKRAYDSSWDRSGVKTNTDQQPLVIRNKSVIKPMAKKEYYASI